MNLLTQITQWLIAMFTKNGAVGNAISSTVLIVGLMLAYQIARRAIRRTSWPTPDARKRWTVMARNISILLILLGLVIIWAEQLQTLALSLVAIALALVIAVKELLLCIGGEVLRSSTRLFTVGSRIEVAGVRGDVIDLNLLTTTIMEVGPGHAAHQYTGRAILVPNSMFLSHPVYNESFTRHYLLHTFAVAVRPEAWAEAERCMVEAANEACESYLDVARRHIERIGDREGLDTPSAGPHVYLGMTEPDRVQVIVRVPVPVRQKSSVEQRILHRFFELFESSGYLKAPLLPVGGERPTAVTDQGYALDSSS